MIRESCASCDGPLSRFYYGLRCLNANCPAPMAVITDPADPATQLPPFKQQPYDDALKARLAAES